MRRPLCPDLRHLLWRRSLPFLVRALDRVLNAEVELRQHVEASEPEHEKHLRRPAPDAFDLDEVIDEVVVVHRLDGVERQRARRHLR